MAVPPSIRTVQSARSAKISRRRVLVGLGAASIASTAGCTTLVDALASGLLGDVNLFNNTETVLEGTITIDGPNEQTVLDTDFEILPETDERETAASNRTDDGQETVTVESESGPENGTAYEDVWRGPGTYDVRVELAQGSVIAGESTATHAADIQQPDEEMLAVFFMGENAATPIRFAVAESLSGFAPTETETPASHRRRPGSHTND